MNTIMDAATQKLLKKYGVTEEDLSNSSQVSFQLDLSGKMDIISEIKELDVQLTPSNEKNAGGGLFYEISSNLTSALGVLSIIISKFGPDVQVALFIAALGTYGVMTASTVREHLIKSQRK